MYAHLSPLVNIPSSLGSRLCQKTRVTETKQKRLETTSAVRQAGLIGITIP